MIFTNQFILTEKDCPEEFDSEQINFGSYYLYFDKHLPVNKAENESTQIIIVGDIYDFENPEFSNLDIAKKIVKDNFSLSDILYSTYKHSGEYLVFYYNLINKDYTIFTDTAAQFELFYSFDKDEVIVAGSSYGLIDLVNPLAKDTTEDALNFYNSEAFKNRKSFIVSDTHFSNLKRLKPNHFLKMKNGETERYFPKEERKKITVDEAAKKAAKMLKGFMEAANHRYQLLIPITAGWDSRVLLAASRNFTEEAIYHVFYKKGKHPKYEKDIPVEIFKKLNLPFKVLENDGLLDLTFFNEIDDTIPFPRKFTFQNIDAFHKNYNNALRINGNISEIARLEFDEIFNLSSKKITFIEKYPFLKYAYKRYHEWYALNNPLFKKYNYRILDMLYWEENCANWVAKGKSEYRIMGIPTFSPFNSRVLILLLYGIDKRYRKKQNPIVYERIVEQLWPELLDTPVNPSGKKALMKKSQKLGIFTLLRNMKLSFNLFLNSNKWE